MGNYVKNTLRGAHIIIIVITIAMTNTRNSTKTSETSIANIMREIVVTVRPRTET